MKESPILYLLQVSTAYNKPFAHTINIHTEALLTGLEHPRRRGQVQQKLPQDLPCLSVTCVSPSFITISSAGFKIDNESVVA